MVRWFGSIEHKDGIRLAGARTIAVTALALLTISAAAQSDARKGSVAEPPAAIAPGPDPGGLPISPNLPLRRDTDALWQTGGIGLGAALPLVLVLALASGWWLWRRRSRPGQTPSAKAAHEAPSPWLALWPRAANSGSLKVLQSVRLTPQASVHRIQWSERELLVGAGPAGLIVLGERPIAPADEAGGQG